MKRTQLGKKEVNEINDRLNSLYSTVDMIDKEDSVVIVDDKYILVDGDICFFYHNNKIIPTLKYLLKNNFLKKITVDMGAVKFVSSGADVMRPGIVEIDPSVKKEDIVAVVDVNNKRPLAVGEALFDAAEMSAMKTGKAVKSLHHVGDDIWNIEL
jgi:PUA-domain protein